MITEAQLYWLTRLDGIKCTMGVWIGGSGFLWFALLVAGVLLTCFGTFFGTGPGDMLHGYGDDAQRMKGVLARSGRRTLYAFAVMLGLHVLLTIANSLIPTTRDMAAIVVIPKIANSQTVQELGSGVVDLAKEWIEELRPDRAKQSSSGQ